MDSFMALSFGSWDSMPLVTAGRSPGNHHNLGASKMPFSA
jgi:hypothetical protein